MFNNWIHCIVFKLSMEEEERNKKKKKKKKKLIEVSRTIRVKILE